MLSSLDPLAASEYQRSVVVSVIELLGGFHALVPENPASFIWEGVAQRHYVEELGRLRDELWALQALLRETLPQLGLCHA